MCKHSPCIPPFALKIGPAGRASCAESGHFVTGVPVKVNRSSLVLLLVGLSLIAAGGRSGFHESILRADVLMIANTADTERVTQASQSNESQREAANTVPMPVDPGEGGQG
jgi:hypothetical protein